MYIIEIDISYIPKSEKVELGIGSTAVHMHRKQYWPCNTTAHECYHAEDFHITKEEEAIERGMI